MAGQYGSGYRHWRHHRRIDTIIDQNAGGTAKHNTGGFVGLGHRLSRLSCSGWNRLQALWGLQTLVATSSGCCAHGNKAVDIPVGELPELSDHEQLSRAKREQLKQDLLAEACLLDGATGKWCDFAPPP